MNLVQTENLKIAVILEGLLTQAHLAERSFRVFSHRGQDSKIQKSDHLRV